MLDPPLNAMVTLRGEVNVSHLYRRVNILFVVLIVLIGLIGHRRAERAWKIFCGYALDTCVSALVTRPLRLVFRSYVTKIY